MTDSIAQQIYTAVIAGIQGLTLAGIEAGEIQLRKVYRDASAISRGITVSPAATSEGIGTNAQDDFGYGMIVYFVTGTGNGYSDDIDRMTLWREQVRKLFHNKRITSVATNTVCKINPGDAYIAKELRKNQDVSALTLRVWTREQRT